MSWVSSIKICVKIGREELPTINQLVRFGRNKATKRVKAPALQYTLRIEEQDHNTSYLSSSETRSVPAGQNNDP